ncbi:MAG: 16S rRNA (guanine(966)-N(2))-methyltransferase RsmD [Candidatus Baltobacteraceae bacterium]
MRLSGGELRSRTLHVPSGRSYRPTPGRVKEALFSIVGARVEEARVLDLFAGSGALGFEALSRGARAATFVERDPRTAMRIRAAARGFGLKDRVTVVCAPAERATRALAGPFDLVFADPPFALGLPHAILAGLLERGALEPEALIVYERPARAEEVEFTGLRTERTARYGDVALQFLSLQA